MDAQTLRAYDQDAAHFAQDWHAQPVADDLYQVLRTYFHKGPTADIGCGSGLHTAWLAANGYPTIGFEASSGLLAEARRRYPWLEFKSSELPTLANIADDTFDNVLCKTVIMHLEPAIIAPSVRRMLAILKPGGVLYLSWRLPAGLADQRDQHGRLYSAFDASLVDENLATATIAINEISTSSSSQKPIRQIVARKS